MAGRPSVYWVANQTHLSALIRSYLDRGAAIDWRAVRNGLPEPRPSIDACQTYWRRWLREEGVATVGAGTPRTKDALTEWLDNLTPINVNPPKRPRTPEKPAGCVLVLSDFHFPVHDPVVCAAALEAVRYLRPWLVVLNGDTCDLLAISRFPKDLRHTWSLQDERLAYHAFLAELFDALAPWGGKVIETDANHSGNGVEGRWWRYLSERLGELASLPEVGKALSYQRVWMPADAGDRISLAPSVQVADDLVILHGDIARKWAGYSANAMLEKWRHSLIHGHTHRLGMTSYRIPAMGSRPESWVAAWEGGCCCQLMPHFTAAPNWANGFAVVRHAEDRAWWNVELVKVTGGRAVLGGPGVMVDAA